MGVSPLRRRTTAREPLGPVLRRRRLRPRLRARRIPPRHRRRGILRGDLLSNQRRTPRGPVTACCHLHHGRRNLVGARPARGGRARRDRREPSAPRHRSGPGRLPGPVRCAARHLLLVQPHVARQGPGGHAHAAPRRGAPLRHVPPHDPRRGRRSPRARWGVTEHWSHRSRHKAWPGHGAHETDTRETPSRAPRRSCRAPPRSCRAPRGTPSRGARPAPAPGR